MKGTAKKNSCHLLKSTKGDSKTIQVCVFHYGFIISFCSILLGTNIVAYYDQLCSTIRHLNCEFILKDKCKSTRCPSCREYRYVLKSTLRRQQIPEPADDQQLEPHTNFRYLTTSQKLQKLRDMRDRLRRSEQVANRAKLSLAKYIQSHGVELDACTSNDILAVNHGS